jgi:hypothetical protein
MPRLSTLTLVALGTVLLGVPCLAQTATDAPPVFQPGRLSVGEMMLVVGARYPTFAGVYVGDGRLHINAAGPIDGAGTAALLDSLYGGSLSGKIAGGVEVHPVRYTYVQLERWYQELVGPVVWANPYCFAAGIDQTRNGFMLRFLAGISGAEVEALLRSVPVPREVFTSVRSGGVWDVSEPTPRVVVED